MFHRCNCRCYCSHCLEAEERAEAWVREQASYPIQTLKLGDTIQQEDGVYFVYYRKVISIYPDIVDKVIQLKFQKCWEPQWWVKLFGRLDADWAPWVYKYATIIVKNNEVVYLKPENQYVI